MNDDLLVRGGEVLDGTGTPAARADVRVRAGRIVEVGPDLRRDGEPEVDASGAYVTPGLIDVHTHVDGALWWDPGLDPMPQHGITTVVTGNCGLSLAPLPVDQRDALVDMFCYIEDLPTSAVLDAVPWGWTTWSEYRSASDAVGAGCNVAPLVGHNNLRLSVLGDESFERAATDHERAHLRALLQACLDAGAFGVSLSMVDQDSAGRRVPGRLASPDEVEDLARTMADAGQGVVQYVPRFMKEDAFVRDIERLDRLCRALGVTHTFAPLPAGRRARARTEAVLARTKELQAEGAAVWPQVSPRSGFDSRIVFDGSSVLFSGMPAWAEMSQAAGAAKAAMLTDPAWRARAREDWESPAFSLFPRRGLPDLLISEVTNPELQAFQGRPFADVLAAWPGHPSDTVARWVLETDAEPCLVLPGTNDADPELLATLLADPGTLVGGSDAGAHVLLFCGAGDSTLLLANHVRDRGDLPLELAVHKLTQLAATAFGIRDRGVVAPGYAGDLTVFALDELRYEREELVADLPGGARRFTRPAGGYRATVVGGTVTQAEGRATGARPGRFLDARSRPG